MSAMVTDENNCQMGRLEETNSSMQKSPISSTQNNSNLILTVEPPLAISGDGGVATGNGKITNWSGDLCTIPLAMQYHMKLQLAIRDMIVDPNIWVEEHSTAGPTIEHQNDKFSNASAKLPVMKDNRE
ncbi:hypothetical protein HAX54_006377, partial [Datura stramonium]|nr:hypothetical protein [Datura stramonium]